jgi:hypothetical protein
MSSTVANNIAQCIGAFVKFGEFRNEDDLPIDINIG